MRPLAVSENSDAKVVESSVMETSSKTQKLEFKKPHSFLKINISIMLILLTIYYQVKL